MGIAHTTPLMSKLATPTSCNTLLVIQLFEIVLHTAKLLQLSFSSSSKVNLTDEIQNLDLFLHAKRDSNIFYRFFFCVKT